MSQANSTPEEGPQRTDYFDQVPVWSNAAENRRFEILADEISGRIPVTRLESWQHFASLLESTFFNPPGVQLAFRGHRRHNWGLTPTLGRLATSGIVSEKLALNQLVHFKRAVRGRLNDHTLVDDAEQDELWAVGQHHGLMTPLLDWTHSPYVALFFAFNEEDGDDEGNNPYRVVYVINKSFVEDDEVCPDIRILEPRKDDHGRLVNQAGLFTFSPYDATIENKLTDILTGDEPADEELSEASEEDQPELLAKYICKIYIRNEDREAGLRHLRKMNVHPASLFPDLIGAANFCNILIGEDHLRQAEKEKQVERAKRDQERQRKSKQVGSRDMEEALTATRESVNHATIIAILGAPVEAQQVEPGRLEIIAEELDSSLRENMVVDWEGRESALARLRNKGKAILRRLGYPPSLRNEAIERVLSSMAEQDDHDPESGERAE